MLYWWNNEGNLELEKNIQELRITTGEYIRLDHSYKITSSFGTIIDKKWILKIVIVFYTKVIFIRSGLNLLFFC